MNIVNYLSIGSDNVLRLKGLQDDVTGAYVATATVTASVKDKDDTPVASGIVCSFVTGSQGEYVGILPEATVLIENELYTVEVIADDGAGRVRLFVMTAIAAYTN